MLGLVALVDVEASAVCAAVVFAAEEVAALKSPESRDVVGRTGPVHFAAD
jgi:hypothetical protein